MTMARSAPQTHYAEGLVHKKTVFKRMSQGSNWITTDLITVYGLYKVKAIENIGNETI